MRLCRLCKRLFFDDQVLCPDDKTSTVEAAAEPLPDELEKRFPEREPLARGGTGTLYLIDRPGSIEDQLGPQLVLKVLAADLTDDPADRARHRRDLRKQKGLIHPQLPAVLEEGEVDGRVWFTREYVPATSLAVRLHQSGAFALDAAINLIVQLSAALDGLHKLGLVHGDLKPGHVLLPAGQPLRLQLIDATLASPLVADNNARRGTPEYAAKEIIEGAASTARSDLYALGCLSYELIAGVSPFRHGSNGSTDTQATLTAQRNFEPKSLPDLVPPVVRSAIASMLSKDARRRPFSAQQVRRSVEPVLSPVKPAARSGSLSALQREAAALRLSAPTAKHRAPPSYPDATVELDVKDLDEAIQASEEQAKRGAQPASAAPKRAASVDDSAPTIALQSEHSSAASSSGVTATHNSEISGAVSSASGTNPYPPVSAQDLERLDHERPARRAIPERGDATQRTHVPSDAAPERASTVDAAFDAQPEQSAEPRRRTRTGTKFGIPAVRLDAASGEQTTGSASGEQLPDPSSVSPASPIRAAADSGAHTSFEAEQQTRGASPSAEGPRRTRTGTMFGIPAVGSNAAQPERNALSSDAASDKSASSVHEPAELPRLSRNGTKFGIPAVGFHSAEPASDSASSAESAPAPADDGPLRARTGTKFGLGPVKDADVEAAALAAQLQRDHGRDHDDVASPPLRQSHPPLREHGLQSPAAAASRARRPRYTTTPKGLAESPRLLLWASGGLAALIILLRLVLGPAERSRSSSIVVHVPEAATELPTPEQAIKEISEQGLIGGDISRVSLAPLAAAEAQQADPARSQAGTEAPASEPDSDDELDADARSRVPTVSAVSVRGGLARATSNRQAAGSGSAPLDFKAQGRELYKAGKYREAADAYQRATMNNPTDAAAYAGLGGSLLATGDVRKAIAAYQKAVQLQPEVSGFQAALGRAYLRKGDRARARAAYSKALELDPNNQAARSGMASAKAR